jgi:hypothetical protein
VKSQEKPQKIELRKVLTTFKGKKGLIILQPPRNGIVIHAKEQGLMLGQKASITKGMM